MIWAAKKYYLKISINNTITEYSAGKNDFDSAFIKSFI